MGIPVAKVMPIVVQLLELGSDYGISWLKNYISENIAIPDAKKDEYLAVISKAMLDRPVDILEAHGINEEQLREKLKTI